MIRVTLAVWRKELGRLLGRPGFYVATAAFVFGAHGVSLSREALALERADLDPLFAAAPLLFCLYLPALSAGLWASEAKSGAIDLTLSLPQPVWRLALGKWLAAWSASWIGLALTSPLWVAASVRGAPDHSAILLGYGFCALAAGALLAIGSAVSAAMRTEGLAYAAAAASMAVLIVCGFPTVQ